MKISLKKLSETIWKLPIGLRYILLSICFFVIILKSLLNLANQDYKFYERIVTIRAEIITISGILTGIFIAYLVSRILQIREERISVLPKLNDLTQKLHAFRKIIKKLVNSSLWVNGLHNHINQNYQGLSFFDVGEIGFVNGKPTQQAKDFVNDHNFGDTASFLLELKSFLTNESEFDTPLHSEFDVPVYYNSKTLATWIKYNCSNGLWYYFGHKYQVYIGDLHLHKVNPEDQQEIKKLCLKIDSER